MGCKFLEQGAGDFEVVVDSQHIQNPVPQVKHLEGVNPESVFASLVDSDSADCASTGKASVSFLKVIKVKKKKKWLPCQKLGKKPALRQISIQTFWNPSEELFNIP